MSNPQTPLMPRFLSLAICCLVGCFCIGEAHSQTPTPSASPSADLVLTVSVDKDPVVIGSNRLYTLTITNNGPSAVTSISFQATFPPRELPQAGSTCDTSCFISSSNNSANGTLSGTLNPGASFHVSLNVQVQTRFSGTFTASISASTSDPNQQNNSASYTTTGPPPATAKLLNISTRLGVQTGDNVLIAGFIVTSGSKHVAVRALGPSLSSFGVPGALQDPTLELHEAGFGLVHANDNWRTDSSSSELQDLGLAPTDDRESAFTTSFGSTSQQSFTAVVSGRSNSTGVGLVEVYDLDRFEDVRLANISTRGLVGTGDNVMIGGFILGGGNGSAALLLRAIGPSLSTIPNRLADPILELYDAQGSRMAMNDNWKDQQEADIRSTGIPPSNDLESAILVTIPSGSYTMILRGTNGGTGIAVVEAYNLQ